MTLELSGRALTLEEIFQVASAHKQLTLSIAKDARERMLRSRAAVEQVLTQDRKNQ